MTWLKQKVQRKFRLKKISEIKCEDLKDKKEKKDCQAEIFHKVFENTQFRFVCPDQRTLSIQFINRSLLATSGSFVAQHQNTHNKKTLVAYGDYFSTTNNCRTKSIIQLR